MKSTSSDRVVRGGLLLVTLAAGLSLYLPIFTILSESVRPATSATWFTLEWYIQAASDQALTESLGRSIFVGLVSATLSSFLGLVCALALVRTRGILNSVLSIQSATALAIPELVLALSLLTGFSLIGLDLGLGTVILAHTVLTLPFSTLVISARLATLNPELERAARDLGADDWQILGRIILPVLIPAVTSAFGLSYLLSFDDFLVTFFVNGVGYDTLPVKLYTSMKAGQSPKLHALSSSILIISLAVAIPLVLTWAQGARKRSKTN